MYMGWDKLKITKENAAYVHSLISDRIFGPKTRVPASYEYGEREKAFNEYIDSLEFLLPQTSRNMGRYA